MLKAILKVILFLATSLIYLYLLPGGSYLFYLFYIAVLSLSFRYDRKYTDVYYLSYLIFSFWGVVAAASYYVSYGETFAPYVDDTFYFKNIHHCPKDRDRISISNTTPRTDPAVPCTFPHAFYIATELSQWQQ